MMFHLMSNGSLGRMVHYPLLFRALRKRKGGSMVSPLDPEVVVDFSFVKDL